ncbi:MAG: LicD family protein [bacterium]|nr:LicD family protein [bacterium]
MKLFGIEKNQRYVIYTIFGIRFSIRKRKVKLDDLQKEVEMLRNIMNCCIDITKVPPAKGELREIQLECAKLLARVKQICENNNLTYWLDFGTLIGAVRHKGFVPWDDDIDICMLRDDYEKILPILKEEFKDSDFYIRERAPVMNYYQIRIINKHCERIGLDIFPVDKYNRGALSQEEKESLTNKIRSAVKIFHSEYTQKRFSGELIQKAKSDMKKIQQEKVLDNKECAEANPALFYGIDYPHRYKMLVFDYDDMFPLTTLKFEGETYPCPNMYDKYLRILYGDYMALPEKYSYE